jgi:hypothetical protein
MNVLITDRDLGFAFWLGQMLGQAGYKALPATDFESAIELIDLWTPDIGLLIVDPCAPGTEAFANSMRCRFPAMKIIAAVEDDYEDPWPPFVDTFQFKPRSEFQDAEEQWLRVVSDVLAPCAVMQ